MVIEKLKSGIVVFITCANLKESKRVASHLIKEKLAACVNTVSKINSVYWWQGRVESADEVLLIAKTKMPLLKKIITEVKKKHSYEVPEIIALPITGGNPDYLKWINESTG